MSAFSFACMMGVALAALAWLSLRVLPSDRWQMLAAVPWRQDGAGGWLGINLTWYGVLLATGFALAVILVVFLMASIGTGLLSLLPVIVVTCLVCLPAARLIARLVEGKNYGFTVGGAFFVGLFLIPLLTAGVNRLGSSWFGHVSVVPSIAAVATAYAFGESVGRLACISDGCCYGKPLDDFPTRIRRILGNSAAVFNAPTRKACYAGGLAGRKLIPIQAITLCVFGITGILAFSLFLSGRYHASLLAAVVGTQVRRALSEFLRADYRGSAGLTAYQYMALFAVIFVLVLSAILHSEPLPVPDVLQGLAGIWQPGVILLVQAIWAGAFPHTGCSMVTGSRLSFHVRAERL